MKGGKACCL